MKFIASLILVFALTGCFASKKGGGNNPQVGAAPIDGEFILQNVSGNYVTPKTTFIAEATVLQKREAPSYRSFYKVLSDIERLPDVTTCETFEIKPSKAAETPLVSVGDITLALYENGQPSMLFAIPEDAKHSYKREFSEVPSEGIHQVSVAGSKNALGFSAKLPIPHETMNLVANNVPFISPTKDPAVIQKSADLQLSWDIKANNQYNALILHVDTLENNVEMIMECTALEKNLPQSGGKVHWTIPAAKMSKLSATNDAFVRLRQYQGTGGTDAKIGKIFLAGVRTQVNLATVNE